LLRKLTISQINRMDHFIPRKIKFKAWNQEARLLMKLDSIECHKGELFRRDHILLQFTGILDRDDEEIYDMDILLIYSEKHLVFWDMARSGWYYSVLKNPDESEPFVKEVGNGMRRFCSFFELQKE